jgi:WD40 repeat protein
VWRYLDGAPPFSTFLPGHTGFMRVQFTGDGKEIITIGDNDQMLRFAARDGRPLGGALESGAPRASRVVAISPEGSTVAVQEADGIVSLWDVRTGTRESVLTTGLTGERILADWSRDGSMLAATSGFDHDLVLWDVSDPRRPDLLHRIGGADAPLPFNYRSPTFSPDGRVVAVNDFPELGWATFIDVRRGRVLRQVSLGFQIGGLVYSPDGTTTITIRYSEGALLVLDAATGTVRAERPTNGWPQEWAFVHRGRRIAIQTLPSLGNSSGPTTLEIWDATTLEPFGEPVTFTGTTGGGEASPDGSKLATGTPGGHGILWNLNPRHWNALACRLAGRNLTREEWNQYLPGRDYHRTCQS